MYPDEWAKTGVKMWQGEYQFIEALGKKKATDFLHAHWDKWVTREDFERLKAGGITHLRIPIGYWILGKDFLRPNDTYIPGGWPYLERALGWASELGLKCIIDLHGAPGAQNGNDNSGFSGPYPCMHPPIPPPPPRGTHTLLLSPTHPTHPPTQIRRQRGHQLDPPREPPSLHRRAGLPSQKPDHAQRHRSRQR